MPDPWTHIDVFRRLDDNTRLGCWSTIITVNYDELTRVLTAPMALAAPLGVDDGAPASSRAMERRFERFQLVLHHAAVLQAGDTLALRDDGDQVIFTVLGPRKATVQLVTTLLFKQRCDSYPHADWWFRVRQSAWRRCLRRRSYRRPWQRPQREGSLRASQRACMPHAKRLEHSTLHARALSRINLH